MEEIQKCSSVDPRNRNRRCALLDGHAGYHQVVAVSFDTSHGTSASNVIIWPQGHDTGVMSNTDLEQISDDVRFSALAWRDSHRSHEVTRWVTPEGRDGGKRVLLWLYCESCNEDFEATASE